jgi:hypothetical protein
MIERGGGMGGRRGVPGDGTGGTTTIFSRGRVGSRGTPGACGDGAGRFFFRFLSITK